MKLFTRLFTALFLALILVIPIYAQEATPEAVAPGVTMADLGEEIVASQPFKIVYISNEPTAEIAFSTQWNSQIRDGVVQAAEDFNVTVEFEWMGDCVTADECIEAQIRLLASLMERDDIDALILTAREQTRLVPIVERLSATGLPIIINQEVNTDQVTSKLLFDEAEMGQMLMEWVTANSNEGDNIVIVDGRVDQSAFRRSSILTAFQSLNVDILDMETANWSETEAYTVMQEWLNQYDDIDTMIAFSDNMMTGMWQAMVEAGREDKGLLAWYGPNDFLMDIQRTGRPSAWVDQQPSVFGRSMVQAAVRYLETGEPLPPVIYAPARLITEENVNEFFPAD